MKKPISTKIIATATRPLPAQEAQSRPDAWHTQEFDTFLVRYDDGTEEKIEAVRGDETYDRLIMYLS